MLNVQDMILKANRLPPKEAIKYLEFHLRALKGGKRTIGSRNI